MYFEEKLRNEVKNLGKILEKLLAPSAPSSFPSETPATIENSVNFLVFEEICDKLSNFRKFLKF